jgi:hypothetical protein
VTWVTRIPRPSALWNSWFHFEVDQRECESRTVVVDGRLGNLDGAGDRDRNLDPLITRRERIRLALASFTSASSVEGEAIGFPAVRTDLRLLTGAGTQGQREVTPKKPRGCAIWRAA